MTDWVDAGGGAPIRAAALERVREAWARLGLPGTWWTGEERLAIAREALAAYGCGLCAQRKAALTPYAVERFHEATAVLPAAGVDAVHRIATDPGRLTERWYRQTLDGGLTDARFVELVAVVAIVVAGRTLARAVGADLWVLPEPEPGEPTRLRPDAAVELAWVPTCGPDRAVGELAEEYSRMALPAGILQALSLVPDEQVAWLRVGAELYVPWDVLIDFARAPEGRALARPQMETIAATVSAANDCFY